MDGAPCQWPLIVPDGCSALDALPTEPIEPINDELTKVTRDDVIAAATGFLWSWTRKVFGLCEVTVRPCREDCAQVTSYEGVAGVARAGYGAPWVPCLVAGQWRNLVCGGCRRQSCSCDTVQAISLPGPVHAVTEVKVDGETVDPAAYRIDNRTVLVRDDGGSWPTCQDLGQPADAEGTWSVTYEWGTPVPVGGQLAVGALACEMAKWVQGQSCELPQRVQTVTREGITVGILDAFEGLEAGRTGLWMVDSWVESQQRPPARSTVHVPRGRRSSSVTTHRPSP